MPKKTGGVGGNSTVYTIFSNVLVLLARVLQTVHSLILSHKMLTGHWMHEREGYANLDTVTNIFLGSRTINTAAHPQRYHATKHFTMISLVDIRPAFAVVALESNVRPSLKIDFGIAL